MHQNDRLQLPTKIKKRGGSYFLRIPKDIVDHLGIRHNHNSKIQIENGEHGIYLSFWIPALQNNGE